MYKKVVELLKKIEYDLFSELKHNFWNKRNFKKRLGCFNAFALILLRTSINSVVNLASPISKSV